MSDEQKLREQIDACRADSEDLHLPELGDLAAAVGSDAQVARRLARSQQFDRAVRAAVHDVPVPSDLLQKLLAEHDAAGTKQEIEGPMPVRRSLVSRRLIGVLSTIAALFLLALGINAFRQRPPEVVTAGELADRADAWMGEVLQAKDWQKDLNLAPQRTHPIPATVFGKAVAWRPVDTNDRSQGVAYDVSRQIGSRAFLFVIRSTAKYPVAAPPAFTRITASRGMTLVAWQQGDRLYVLAVQEDGQRIEDFLRRQPQA